MPQFGLRNLVMAPIATETDNAIPTYGTAVTDLRARKAAYAWSKSEVLYYADDTLAESDPGISGGTLTLTTAELPLEMQAVALNVVAESGSSPSYYEDTDQPGTPVGVGYVQTWRLNGKNVYKAIIYYKVLFAPADEDSATKEASITFADPSIAGTVYGLQNDTSGKSKFRRFMEFGRYSDAVDFINNFFLPSNPAPTEP
jgi:phi13 family phage major tail protein